MMSAISAMPSVTRRPTPDVMKAATVESWVEPAISASEKTMTIIAGSASVANIDFAARAQAAEARADVEPGEREEEAAGAEQRDDGDEVGRPREQEPRGEGRDQRGGDPGRGEHEVGHEAEQPRGAVGDDRLLAREAHEITIGLQERRTAPTLSRALVARTRPVSSGATR